MSTSATQPSVVINSTYRVVGLTCDHCVRAVIGEVSAIAGVRRVGVDLSSGILTVASEQPLAPADVAAAVDEAGYQLAP